jgi:hypothetical protein
VIAVSRSPFPVRTSVSVPVMVQYLRSPSRSTAIAERHRETKAEDRSNGTAGTNEMTSWYAQPDL